MGEAKAEPTGDVAETSNRLELPASKLYYCLSALHPFRKHVFEGCYSVTCTLLLSLPEMTHSNVYHDLPKINPSNRHPTSWEPSTDQHPVLPPSAAINMSQERKQPTISLCIRTKSNRIPTPTVEVNMQRRTRRATRCRQKRQNLRLPIHVDSRISLTRIPILVLNPDGTPRRSTTLHPHDPQRPVRRATDPPDGLGAGAAAAGGGLCAVGEGVSRGFGFGGGFGGPGGPCALEGEDPVYLVLLGEFC
jgi:hypothetical protein